MNWSVFVRLPRISAMLLSVMLAVGACADDAPETAPDGGRDAATEPMNEADASPADASPADASPADATAADADVADAEIPDAGTSSTTWAPTPVKVPPIGSACSGETFVRWLPAYQRWIAVILCTPTRYKIMMGDSADGPFLQLGDFAGSGQDHCELVNPDFTIPDEDDIRSGGCEDCTLGPYANPGEIMPPPAGYSRSRFGMPFVFQPAWPRNNLYTPAWVECGIALP